MSIDCSKKEYLYLVYLKLFPKQLETALNMDISDIALEKKFGKRKVDISGYVNSYNRRIMIEVQLSPSNDVHSKQVQELICTSREEEDVVVVWIATKFKEEHITEIKQNVAYSCNNIEFIALSLDESVIKELEIINEQDPLKQIQLLERLNSCCQKHFEFIEGIKGYNGKNTINIKLLDNNTNYSYKQQYLLQIIKQMRKDCRLYTNVHQYKKVDGNSFSMGANFQDIEYKVTYNRKGLIGIEVVFGQVKSKQIFYKLLERKCEIEDELDYMINLWDSNYHKIATYINPLSFRDKENTIKMIVRIMKKYIYVVDKYLKEAIGDRSKVILGGKSQ